MTTKTRPGERRSAEATEFQLPAVAQLMLTEAVGTFSLVFAGTGAVVIDSISGGGVGSLGIGLAFGLIIMAMVYTIGHISGAHINPAVTIAFAAARHFPQRQVPAYLAGQLGGAILASLLLRAMFGNEANLGTTLPSGSDAQSLVLEVVITFFLMIVIMAVATDSRAVGHAAAIAIGGTIGLGVIIAGPISGGSMNPARSLAPALVSWTWQSQWVYVVGPICGALLGAFVYKMIRGTGWQGTA